MIEVEDLRKNYGDIQALKGVGFRIDRGEIIGFLGPNGAGKTTAMKILTGYMPPSSGRVTIDDLDIGTDSLSIRRKLGYLPESNALYDEMLVYDYLGHVGTLRGIPREQLHERIAKACNLCGLTDRVGQPIATLSRGFRQRVGLAQALIHDPEILILDEPTSGLDPNQIVEIRNLIKELGRHRTIILSTHNLPEVMATCNRMLIVHQGELAADGTPEELQAREEERPRVKVLLRGVEEAEARKTLEGLDEVDTVRPEAATTPETVALELIGQPDTDIRPAVFKTVVDHGWELVELHREVLDLEGIFRKLTEVS